MWESLLIHIFKWQKYITNICKSGSIALKDVGKIRNYTSQSDWEHLVHAFITSKLDMFNSTLTGLQLTDIDNKGCGSWGDQKQQMN